MTVMSDSSLGPDTKIQNLGTATDITNHYKQPNLKAQKET